MQIKHSLFITKCILDWFCHELGARVVRRVAQQLEEAAIGAAECEKAEAARTRARRRCAREVARVAAEEASRAICKTRALNRRVES